jgi:hypothetical protein
MPTQKTTVAIEAGGRMKQRKRVIRFVVWLAIAGLGIFWLTTGSLVVYDYSWYGGFVTLPVDGGPPIVLTVDTHVQDVGVPFVFSYLSDHVPYTLEIAAYDDGKGKITVTLFIDDLSIVYPDGRAVQVISPMDRWTQDFQRYRPASLSEGPLNGPPLRVERRLERAIGEATDFRVTISGRYSFDDGSLIDFAVGHTFHAKKRSTIGTGWEREANV